MFLRFPVHSSTSPPASSGPQHGMEAHFSPFLVHTPLSFVVICWTEFDGWISPSQMIKDAKVQVTQN